MVVPYTFDEVASNLNQVAPYDWAGFLHERIYSVQPHSPIKGIEGSGWKLVYNDKPNDAADHYEGDKGVNLDYSIGLSVGDDGVVTDVLPDSPSAKAGLSPGMKLMGVNGMKFSTTALKEAVAKSNKPQSRLQLLTQLTDDTIRTMNVRYRGGARYPHLERDASIPDLLSEIAAPHAKP
jgi:predicted metalloprotease with PDZ domain